jgi:hypothetical protein
MRGEENLGRQKNEMDLGHVQELEVAGALGIWR